MKANFTVSRVYYAAAQYKHPPAGLLELRLVRTGSSNALIDLGAGPRRVFTRPGDLLFSLGNRATAFAIEDGRELTLVRIPVAVAAKLIAEAGGKVAELAVLADRPLRDPLVAELCRRLEEFGQDSSQGHSQARSAMRDWALALVLGLMLDAARARSAHSHRQLLTAGRLKIIEARIHDKLTGRVTVDELAALAGMNRRAFTLAFRESTGLPVYQFVLRKRVEQAIKLLTTTKMPLADVAARSGFSHQPHMTRVLRRLTGRTPGELREPGSNQDSASGVVAKNSKARR